MLSEVWVDCLDKFPTALHFLLGVGFAFYISFILGLPYLSRRAAALLIFLLGTVLHVHKLHELFL